MKLVLPVSHAFPEAALLGATIGKRTENLKKIKKVSHDLLSFAYPLYVSPVLL